MKTTMNYIIKKKWKIFFKWLLPDKKEAHQNVEEAMESETNISASDYLNYKTEIPLFEEVDAALEQHTYTSRIEEQPNTITTSEEKKEESTKKENATTPVKVSLLDNAPYIKLMEQNSAIIQEFEGYLGRMGDAALDNFIELSIHRLRESMFLSGATPIDNEVFFSLLRHTPVPMSLCKEGKKIKEFLEPGVTIENRVFVKAKVRLVDGDE